jgi:hypothetical protein
MAEIADLADFGEEHLRDDVILNYRGSGKYLPGSNEANDLCDEIQRLEIGIWTMRGQNVASVNQEDRSTTVREALLFYRDYKQSQLENYLVEAGEL